MVIIEKLFRLCEEKQEELEAMSKEYLALMEELGKSKELTYEDLKEVRLIYLRKKCNSFI